jgi:YVTN family beta-propeller protein
MAVMLEDENAVAFVDAPSRQVVKVLHGFSTPHFMRFSKDGKKGYVANLSGNHITEVDMASLAVSGEIALEGAGAAASEAVAEGGFADAQIDETGVLYAAHGATGRVLAFDTVTRTRLPEIAVGSRPWVVFADHHFRGVNLTHVVPNFDSATVSLIDGAKKVVKANVPGDKEAYGVNYSSLVPGKAFVMNRVREEIAVMDLATSTVEKTLPVGGNTETASTSADGKYIVATVSRANRVVIIDAKTQTIVKTFENVGKYPWSVAIPGGQNYCH